MKLYLTFALIAVIGISTSIAQTSATAITAATFKCYERVGKFAHGSNVAVVVSLNDQSLNVTSLRGDAASVAYDMQSVSVVNTRNGEWLRAGDFTIENNGVERLAYYHYSKEPLEHLALKCFIVK